MQFETYESLINGGCSFFATKRISKTAEKRTNNKKTTIQVWFLIITAVMIIEMSPLGECAPTTHKHNSPHKISRTRHYRHVGGINAIEWTNACAAIRSDNYSPFSASVSAKRGVYNKLREHITLVTLQTLSVEKNNDSIPIDDIGDWSIRNVNYTFLPRVKKNSTVMLTRWHRNMQIYVASFQYLRSKQSIYEYEYDQNKTKELETLKVSSIHLLCEIELAIIATSNAKLLFISEKKMEHKLKYLIERSDDFELDLKFTKQRFYKYARQMRRAIKKWQSLHPLKKTNSRGSKAKSSSLHSGSYVNSDQNNISSLESLESSSTLRKKLNKSSQQ